MDNELLDNDFILTNKLHHLERLGFKMVKNDESRTWTGNSNLYTELKSFEKNDEQFGQWTINIEAKKGESGSITFNRINGNLKLLKKFHQNKISIKSINKIWLFRKPKNKVEKYYVIKPPVYSAELGELLIMLYQCNININVSGGLMNFEFNFDSFPESNYEHIVQILKLAAS